MSPLSDQEIAAARRVSVLEYFRTCLPCELIQVSAHDYRTKTHSSLVISDNGLFHWYSGGVGGNNAIDYLTKVEKLDFVSAVHRLNDLRPVLVQEDQRERPSSKEPRPFVQPARDNSDLKARAYLRGRGICEPVLQFCLGTGTLYQSRHGRYTNCVFLGLDANGTACSAFSRGCEGGWRGDAPGSQKKYGFTIPAATQDCPLVFVYEAPIDALSGATLRWQERGKDWRDRWYLALGGLNYQPLEWFLDNHPETTVLYLCLDNDRAGRQFSARIQERLANRGYRIVDAPPRCGKDYNELLLRKKQSRKHGER